MRATTITTGPDHRITASPYRTMPQKLATSKKLSQGSPVVHVSSPTSLLRGSRKGCEYASARVICGGVAINNGDFWCTRMVERCLFALTACDRVTGEKEATVGGFGSATVMGAPSPSLLGFEVGDIESSQGVSWRRGQYCSGEVVALAKRTMAAIYNVIAGRGQGGWVCDQVARRRSGDHERRSIPSLTRSSRISSVGGGCTQDIKHEMR